MGHGRWDSGAYTDYSSTYAKSSRAEVFKNRSIKEYMDPTKVVIRESRDSADNPASNAIVVALDVTGSMGIIAEKIAKQGLGTLVAGIYDRKPVTDPHVMIMAYGDVFCDNSPLQATQFEADIRLAEQLRDIYLEGGGGGNAFESDDLVWRFAATKTSIDCFEKRNKKGYLFTIGDENPPQRAATKGQLNEAIGGSDEVNLSTKQILELAQEKYDVFHIIVEQGDFARRQKMEVTSNWRALLGKRAIGLNDYDCVAEVILSVIEVAEGADPNQVVSSWEDRKIKAAVSYALFGND